MQGRCSHGMLNAARPASGSALFRWQIRQNLFKHHVKDCLKCVRIGIVPLWSISQKMQNHWVSSCYHFQWSDFCITSEIRILHDNRRSHRLHHLHQCHMHPYSFPNLHVMTGCQHFRCLPHSELFRLLHTIPTTTTLTLDHLVTHHDRPASQAPKVNISVDLGESAFAEI